MKKLLMVALVFGSMSVFPKSNRVTCSCGNPPKTVVCLTISNATMSQCDHCCRRVEYKDTHSIFRTEPGGELTEILRKAAKKSKSSKRKKR